MDLGCPLLRGLSDRRLRRRAATVVLIISLTRRHDFLSMCGWKYSGDGLNKISNSTEANINRGKKRKLAYCISIKFSCISKLRNLQFKDSMSISSLLSPKKPRKVSEQILLQFLQVFIRFLGSFQKDCLTIKLRNFKPSGVYIQLLCICFFCNSCNSGKSSIISVEPN